MGRGENPQLVEQKPLSFDSMGKRARKLLGPASLGFRSHLLSEMKIPRGGFRIGSKQQLLDEFMRASIDPVGLKLMLLTG